MEFASGTDQASWLMLTNPARRVASMMMMPRSDFDIIFDATLAVSCISFGEIPLGNSRRCAEKRRRSC